MSAQDLSPRDELAQCPSVQSESPSSPQLTEVLQRLGNIEAAMALLRFPMPLPMLKTSEAAKILKVSESSIRRWIERGELKASRFDLGQRVVYRIKQVDLETFIDGSSTGETLDAPTALDTTYLTIPEIEL